MKFLILVLCLSSVLANESLLDELDKILSSNTAADSKSTDTLDKVKRLLMSHDETEDMPSEEDLDLLEKRLSSSNPAADNEATDALDDIKRMLDLDESEDMPSEDDLLEKRISRKPKFGYCLDKITKAQGPNKQGCSRALCYDKEPGTCDRKFASEYTIKDSRRRHSVIKNRCYGGYMFFREYCPFTCDFCKPASPEKDCQKKFRGAAKWGCCVVGGAPALGPNKQGCLKCRDFYPHVCKQFMRERFGIKCYTNSYRLRTFYDMYCPLSCKRCRPGEM